MQITGWPDYVFNKTYTLTPLMQLKSYIDQNHHLPEMPTAAEIEKNGQNLGEINKLLTKKVEELTLYIIDKDNELKEMKTALQIQNKKIEQLQQQMERIILNK